MENKAVHLNWHKVTISGFTDAEEARQRAIKELELAFEQKFRDHLSPDGAALFSTVESRPADTDKD